MDYFELECAVENWAEEKGILDKTQGPDKVATPMAQALKRSLMLWVILWSP
jgi:hypothetical protein